VVTNSRAMTAPGAAIRGPYACLPQMGVQTADGLFLPEHPIRVLLQRVNDLRFGARRGESTT
jgi:hypothetical protein